ncbi:hypothetical protein PV08_03405 [Exophiala spinifera]|uniref:T6SS Phospholipase effector Tle1-like catalytic domain-containing protein n=1 Tax=Exophiala spinifera TaxID=91928 RepID=A0A0D2BJN0_9EURO|nr:uncharacterized protein PV08_03405 [Exophiala spinifera]KIW19113.1 hypothetical protein PV08_03405 [Exophiala spinifera]
MATKTSKKRIIICCDGTWMDSDGDYQTPSNVTRIARAIPPVGFDKTTDPPQAIHQIVFYQNGVGTGDNSLYNRYIGGATGEGLAEHIREAYSFVALNYSEGDEIFIIGFSRGAFTARSISSLINAVGLLTSKGLEYFVQVFEDWEFQQRQDFVSKWPNIPFPGHKPPVTDAQYQQHLIENNLTRPGIKIKCVAVWDTVGGLGIPMIGLLPQPPSKDFAFVDTRVESNIEYAFQALALDEHRRAYSPTIWEWPSVEPNELKVLKQTWFPGVHSDIGGSYDDTALANLTLAWMVSQLDPILTVDHSYIFTLIERQSRHAGPRGHLTFTHEGMPKRVENTAPHSRPWGLGKIHNSMTPFFRLGGSRIRTPGEYREAELASQRGTLVWMFRTIASKVFGGLDKPTPRLKRTNETVHASVRIRRGKHGYGYNDKGTYDPPALKGWVLHGTETNPDTPIAINTPGQVGKMTGVVYKKVVSPEVTERKGKGKGKGKARVRVLDEHDKDHTLELREEPLGVFERQILQLWPEIQRDFDSIGSEGARLDRVQTYPINQRAGAPGTNGGLDGLSVKTKQPGKRSETS